MVQDGISWAKASLFQRVGIFKWYKLHKITFSRVSETPVISSKPKYLLTPISKF